MWRIYEASSETVIVHAYKYSFKKVCKHYKIWSHFGAVSLHVDSKGSRQAPQSSKVIRGATSTKASSERPELPTHLK